MDIKLKQQPILNQEQLAANSSNGSFLNRLIKHSIYALVFLMPLFFLPWSYEKIEYNKQILLWVLAGIAFLAWIARMVFIDKEIKIRRNLADIAVFGFLIINFIILLLSKNFYASLWGYFGRYSDSFLGLAAMCGFYFVVVNNYGRINTNQERISTNHESLLRIFLFSTFIAEIVLILSLYGLLPAWMPGNLMGAFGEGAAMFVAVMLSIAIHKIPNSNLLSNEQSSDKIENKKQETRNKKQIISNFQFLISNFPLYLYIFISLISLAILNFKPAWILLIIAMMGEIFILVYRKFRRGKISPSLEEYPLLSEEGRGEVGRGGSSCFIVPVIVIVIVIAAAVIVGARPLAGALDGFISYSEGGRAQGTAPTEARLSAKESFLIAAKSLKEMPVWGSGQGNFIYNFAKFKSLDLAKSNLGILRFNKAGNYIAEIIATMGVLGILGWIGMILALILNFKFQISKKYQISNIKYQKGDGELRSEISESANQENVSLFLCFFVSLLSFFLYSSTTLLLFTFWLMLAANEGGHTSTAPTTKKIFEKFPEALAVAKGIAAVLILIFCGFLIKITNKYRANIIYAEAAAVQNAEEQNLSAQQIPKLEKAFKLDKKNSLFSIALARLYISELKKEMAKAPSDRVNSRVKELAEKTVFYAVSAADLDSQSVSAWELRGSVYRDIYPVVGEAEKAMLESFKKAAELEPVNPILLTELGKAQALNNEDNEARKSFEAALNIAKDYDDAKLQLAKLKEKFGKSEEAIAELQEIGEKNKNDATIKFEIGRIMYNKGDIDGAISSFQEAIRIFPNYSNALYSLALCYIRKENKEEVLKLFKKVLELNPGNKDVQSKIEEMGF